MKKSLPPSSLMKKIISALSSIGYRVKSRESNLGAMKAWLNSTTPKKRRPPEPDTSAMTDEEFENYLDAKEAALEASSLAAQEEFMSGTVKTMSPGRIAMPFKKALRSAGLDATVSGDGAYETVLRGRGFEVIIPQEGSNDIGADVFVKVFAGKYANLERSGYDTTDLAFGEGVMKTSFVLIEGPKGRRTGDIYSPKGPKGSEWYVKEYQAKDYINDHEPDEVCDYNIVDADTSLIYLDAGDNFGKSKLHREHDLWKSFGPFNRGGDDVDAAEDDGSDDDRLEQEYRDAVAEFAAQWEGAINDLGPDVSPEDAAPDAAEGFFYEYPQWPEWCRVLHMKKQWMKEAIADYVYDAMVKGRGMTEGLLDPQTPSKQNSDSGQKVDRTELEDWAGKSGVQDSTDSGSVEKFQQGLNKTFGDREMDADALEVLYKKYPKMMAHMEKHEESKKMNSDSGRLIVESRGNIPSSFDEFRKMFAVALRKSGAPEDLTQEVEDVGYEGGGVVSELYHEWDAMQYELKSPETKKEIQQSGFVFVFESYIYDAVINMVSEFRNTMNYAPGHRPPKIDDIGLANEVLANWGGKDVDKSTAEKARKSMDEFVGNDPALKVAEDIVESLRIEGNPGATIVPDPKNTPDLSTFYVNVPEQKGVIFPSIAEFILDEMTARNASRNYGFRFEDVRTDDAITASVDVEDSDQGAYTIMVDLSSLFFDHVGNIAVVRTKF